MVDWNFIVVNVHRKYTRKNKTYRIERTYIFRRVCGVLIVEFGKLARFIFVECRVNNRWPTWLFVYSFLARKCLHDEFTYSVKNTYFCKKNKFNVNFRSYVGSLRVANCGEKLRNLIFLFSSSMLHLSSHLEKELTWIWGLDKNYLERGISSFVQQFTFILNCWSLCYSLFRSNISIFIYNNVLFVKFECLL